MLSRGCGWPQKILDRPPRRKSCSRSLNLGPFFKFYVIIGQILGHFQSKIDIIWSEGVKCIILMSIQHLIHVFNFITDVVYTKTQVYKGYWRSGILDN